VRFVNYQVKPELTLLSAEDATILANFTQFFNGQTKYEGDAALGWFANNQSAYPVATEVRGLKWDGVDLRHQIFTEKVNFGNFDDGDKNTAVIDRDGSLTGFKVVIPGGRGTQAKDQYPISLNNLPFNSAVNSVDECLAQGAQDTANENRPVSLISPANYGTLEFEAFQLPDGVVPSPPPPGQKDNRVLTQFVTFTRDVVDYGAHQTMQLHSKNNQGVWEPKIASGLGYTITAQDSSAKYPGVSRKPGMPRYINVGLTDVVKPDIKVGNEFYARIGVCYTNQDGTYPTGDFEVTRGYRSWGGNGTDPNDTELRRLFIYLDQAYPIVKDPVKLQSCFNLAAQNPFIMNDPDNCPGVGIYGAYPGDQQCPFGGTPDKDRNNLDVCAFYRTTLGKASSLSEITKADGTPANLDKWYYDPSTGMLFFYVKQERPNARGPSPLGSCPPVGSDASCPNPDDPTFPENYYICPPEGCVNYAIRLKDPDHKYDPGPSKCGGSADPTAIYALKPAYTQPRPTGQTQNQLAYVVPPNTIPTPPYPDGAIVEAKDVMQQFPHRIAAYAGNAAPPVCKGTP
jgi:hypothetical protein